MICISLKKLACTKVRCLAGRVILPVVIYIIDVWLKDCHLKLQAWGGDQSHLTGLLGEHRSDGTHVFAGFLAGIKTILIFTTPTKFGTFWGHLFHFLQRIL